MALTAQQHNTTIASSLAGITVAYDCAGALYLPDAQTLVFSDLHFEKGSSYGRKGLFLPPYDTRRTLMTMLEVIERWQPHSIISLGDAFHDGGAEARMSEDDRDLLCQLTEKYDWIWILGNHDPTPPRYLAGKACAEITVGGLSFSHEPCERGNWQVAGHFHPAAKVRRGGRAVRRRCFMTDGARLIMPAFGAYTGGLNVRDSAYQPYFPEGFAALMLGSEQVWQVASAELKPDN
ncbi:ligase-associated DNA damage response endonuclease PdeM [Parvularcula sp. IMCC14364]|uniref:ligase-associated DNA damage response endonuclease PdeM n=1 Tax=Parvularcula sp. IMCC14364 TaxID=3067902 RepID=UPI0027418273|nr:ligase-associated DNA damage response endonuclease PdeM [Parvularcula sp. IMCC14364]